MIRGKSISLVIPCYNEEEGISFIMNKLPACVDEVIVADNNCTDRTAEIAANGGATVVKEILPGYGYAYRRGLASATKDIIVTMDGDSTYPMEAIEPLVNNLLDRQLEFISAMRFPLANRKAMPLTNKIGNAVLTMATNLLFGVGVRDSQTGMWVFYRSLLKEMELVSGGMSFSEEIKIEAIRKKKRFAEIHIRYEDRLGKVKLNRWKDGFSNLWFLFRKRFSR